MKKELFKTYIKRFGVETLKRITMSYISEDDVEGFIDINSMSKKKLINKILEDTGGENTKIAPLVISNFGCYHQHVFFYRTEDKIDLSAIAKNIHNLNFPGFGGNETKFAYSDVQGETVKILLYVPFRISFHIHDDNREERRYVVLHTPVLIRLFPLGMIISIMTFTKGDWSEFLSLSYVDSRSLYKDAEALNLILKFIEKGILENHLFTLNFTNKAKELLKMEEADLFSGTKIEKCESRHSTLLDAFRKRETLKDTVPEKVNEIIMSPIITNLDIIFVKSAFSLPEGTRMILYPKDGSLRINKHIEEGNLNEIQDYLFS